jgi:hypothetical protein
MPRNKEKRSDQEQRLKEMAARRSVPLPSVKRIEQLTLRVSAKPSKFVGRDRSRARVVRG